MTIPFLGLRAAYIELKVEIDSAVARVLDSGRYVLEAEVEAFEKEFAEYCAVKECIGVANGLDALHLALLAMDVGPGDEVIVPSNTYIATWLAVSKCGATPVPVEPLDTTSNINPELFESAITPKTKVILPVHLYGKPADLDPIMTLADEHDLYVLEDAAQAQGAIYKGKRIGGHRDAVTWSFYPGKNLGAMGDAGAVTTNNQELAEKIRLLCNYGSSAKYVNEVRGYNSGLDPIQAGIPIPPHKQKAYADQPMSDNEYPIAVRMAAETLSLPFGPHLAMTDLKKVSDALRSLCRPSAHEVNQ